MNIKIYDAYAHVLRKRKGVCQDYAFEIKYRYYYSLIINIREII